MKPQSYLSTWISTLTSVVNGQTRACPRRGHDRRQFVCADLVVAGDLIKRVQPGFKIRYEEERERRRWMELFREEEAVSHVGGNVGE